VHGVAILVISRALGTLSSTLFAHIPLREHSTWTVHFDSIAPAMTIFDLDVTCHLSLPFMRTCLRSIILAVISIELERESEEAERGCKFVVLGEGVHEVGLLL